MNYHYDQVYPYELLLKEVKNLLFPTILNSIDQADVEKTGFRKQDLAEIIYTQITALGYNNKDVYAALNDLLPMRNPIIYPGPIETEAANMAMHLDLICNDFEHQLNAFQIFHQMTQDLKSYDEVISSVKMNLLPIQ